VAGRAPVADMPGWIMPAPLHMPPMRTVLPAKLEFNGDLLRPRIARHDRFDALAACSAG
jgi:hypothetical protein